MGVGPDAVTHRAGKRAKGTSLRSRPKVFPLHPDAPAPKVRPASRIECGLASKPMSYEIRPLLISDYEEVYRLWSQSEGITLEDDDERDHIALYLKRNPGLCHVATVQGRIVGSVLCGHDGRRAVLRHLAVEKGHRKQGMGRALIAKVLAALREQGIRKCNIYVMDYNAAGLEFWRHAGARLVVYDWRTFQITVPASPALAPTLQA